MKWFDKWIEKQYLKKHPKKEEPCIDPTAKNEYVIRVKELKPVDIHADVKLYREDLDHISERDVYLCICKCMGDELMRCMHIDYQYDYASNKIYIHSTLSAYTDEFQEPGWFNKIKNGSWLK